MQCHYQMGTALDGGSRVRKSCVGLKQDDISSSGEMILGLGVSQPGAAVAQLASNAVSQGV